MARVTANARRPPPDSPHHRSLRERLIAAGAVAALVWFALLVITSVVVWISLDQ